MLEAKPETYRAVANILEGEINRSNRNVLLPRYRGASDLVQLGLTCLKAVGQEGLCAPCKDMPQPMCERLETLRLQAATNTRKSVI